MPPTEPCPSPQHTAGARRGSGPPWGPPTGQGGLGAWAAASHACGWPAGVDALCGPAVAAPSRAATLAALGRGGQAQALPAAWSTHIWSQGSRCSEASRSGLGSLTKMSPLQVVDQMACAEGRPWTFQLSQQERLSRASWRREEAGQHWAGGRQRAEAGLPLAPRPGGAPPTHPVVHVLLRGGSQTHRPALPGPLGGVQGEGVLGLAEHGHQRRHLVQEHVQVLHTEGGRQAVSGDGQGRPGPPRFHGAGPRGPGLRGSAAGLEVLAHGPR